MVDKQPDVPQGQSLRGWAGRRWHGKTYSIFQCINQQFLSKSKDVDRNDRDEGFSQLLCEALNWIEYLSIPASVR